MISRYTAASQELSCAAGIHGVLASSTERQTTLFSYDSVKAAIGGRHIDDADRARIGIFRCQDILVWV